MVRGFLSQRDGVGPGAGTWTGLRTTRTGACDRKSSGSICIGMARFRRHGARIFRARDGHRGAAGHGVRRRAREWSARNCHGARCVDRARSAFVFLGLTVIRLGLRNSIGAGGPLPKVDQFAAFRTKRSEGIVLAPYHGRLAVRTVRPARWCRVRVGHRLQNVSSKSRSSAIVRRCVPSALVNRMFRAYLFALTSGTQS